MNKKHWLPVGMIAALTALTWWGGVAQTGEKPTADQLKAGKFVYERACETCHGAQGKGDGIAAPHLSPRPRDFTRGVFKFRTTPDGVVPTDSDLERTIKHGLNSTAMSPWVELSKQDMRNLIAYIQTFSEQFKKETVAPIKIPAQTAFSMGAVDRGKKWFAELECWKCHGTEGRGDGPSAAELKDSWDNPIRPADLTRPSQYKRGASPLDIYTTFFTGLSGTPMPSYADTLEKPEHEWELVYYVYWLSQGKSLAKAERAMRTQSFPRAGNDPSWVK